MWEICAADAHDSRIQVAINQACKWSAKNMKNVNSEKTKEMIISFSRKRNDVPAVIIDQKAIERTETFKLLGVLLSDDLDWGPHVEYLLGKCSQRIYLLVLLKHAGDALNNILSLQA